jgi:hypothetical protein
MAATTTSQQIPMTKPIPNPNSDIPNPQSEIPIRNRKSPLRHRPRARSIPPASGCGGSGRQAPWPAAGMCTCWITACQRGPPGGSAASASRG